MNAFSFIDRSEVRTAPAGVTAVRIGQASLTLKITTGSLLAGALLLGAAPMPHVLKYITASILLLLAWRFLFRLKTRRDRHPATRDCITGLENHWSLMNVMENLALSDENPDFRFSLIHIQMARLETVYDFFGWDVGASFLRTVAGTIRNAIGGVDRPFSLGDGRFAVICMDDPSGPDAEQKVRRLTARLNGSTLVDGHRLATAASIGVAVFPDDSALPEQLLRFAFIATAEARRLGPGRFAYHRPYEKVGVQDRMEMVHHLSRALGNGELSVVYQPIYSARNRQILSVEALARWNHPVRGIVPPAEFIPLAEQSGLIREIGAWVIREAFRRIAEIRNKSGTELSLSINISPVQLEDWSIYDVLLSAGRSAGLPPEAVNLEITEGLFLQTDTHNLAIISDIRKLGFKIALDDFGTGYSSLGYLSRLAVDSIKIDRIFIDAIGCQDDARSIIKAIIDIARIKGLKTVAEGVEVQNQLTMLDSLGCDMVQGFLLSRPVSLESLKDLVSGNSWLPEAPSIP